MAVDCEVKALPSADPRALDLVESYGPGAAFFTSPFTTLLGGGLEPLPAVESGPELGKRLAARVSRALVESEQGVVMGALPFDSQHPARLVLSHRVERAGTLPAAPRRWQSSFEANHTLRATPSPDGYRDAVTRALRLIESNELSKVVVGRMLELHWQQGLDVAALLRGLLARRRGFGFAMDVEPSAPGRRTLLGVSPELLLRRSGLDVTSHPLAGSMPRSEDPEEDQRAAAELLASEKDRREHALVVEAVARDLRRYCRLVEHAPQPSLVKTETLWHLGTEIRGLLSAPGTTSLELALALHPTPAVCGHPTHAARRAITQLEPFERGLFTGAVGWCDESGDGEWAVTIRAGEVEENRLRVFAGAGIVQGSLPERELEETTAKLGTLLRVLGVSVDEIAGGTWS